MVEMGPPAIVMAAGEQPDWKLERRGDMLVLRRAGQAPVMVKGIQTRRTPFGTHILAGEPHGPILTLRIGFAGCRLERQQVNSSYRAVIDIAGQRLYGCALAPLPGDKPLLD